MINDQSRQVQHFYLAHLHVVGVRLGPVVKVGYTHVHGVVGRHLVPLQVGAGWGLEDTEKDHVY